MKAKQFKLAPQNLIGMLIAALLAPPAGAEELADSVIRLIKPESTVMLGVGYGDKDNQRFGMYSGMAANGTHLIGEASLVRRDEDGTWLRLQGRNLGLDTREVRMEHEQPGRWSYYLDYNAIPRVTPYEVHTAVTGLGSNSLTVPNAAGVRSTAGASEIKTDRDVLKLGASSFVLPGLEIKFKYQYDEKKGTRLFGRGTGTTQEFLAEPINSRTHQLDVVAEYLGKNYQLNGGYYGSLYNNQNTALNVAGGNAAFNVGTLANPSYSPIALAPDNLAHQLHLAGAYDFNATTRGSFKYSYDKNTQTDAFIALPTGGTNISGRGDMGGRVDTTLLQFGLSARPLKALTMLGNLRYENRADKSAVARYLTAGGATDGYNERRSLKTLVGKVEAIYLLPDGYRLSGGIEREDKTRGSDGVRIVGYRERNAETSYRVELRRSLFEELSGAVSYVHSDRRGSGFKTLTNFNGTLYNAGGQLQPIYIADRNRDKLKLFADWNPTEPLNLQFALEDSRDAYARGRDALNIGPRSGSSQLYSVDASYTVSAKWQATAWASQLLTRMNQATGSTLASYWSAGMKNDAQTIGLGLRGKPSGALEIGADVLLARDLNGDTLGGAASSLPGIDNYQTTLKLFGKYAWDKDLKLRLDLVHDRRRSNDWTWNGPSVPYVYTDGTWLYQNPNQRTTFIGFSADFSFR